MSGVDYLVEHLDFRAQLFQQRRRAQQRRLQRRLGIFEKITVLLANGRCVLVPIQCRLTHASSPANSNKHSCVTVLSVSATE